MDNLFRKEAVDGFSSKLDTNRRIRAVTVRWRVIFILLLMFTTVFTTWFFAGTVNESVTVQGIVWPNTTGGKVQSESYGNISKIVVSLGDQVSAGDIIAVIPDSGDIAKLREDFDTLTQEEIDKIYDDYHHTSLVRSPVDGVVVWTIEENSWVAEDEMIAYIAPYNNDLDYTKVIAYIESSKSGLVEPNMDVHIIPEYAPEEKYGYISAYVSDIDKTYISGKTIKESNAYMPSVGLEDDVNYVTVEITMHFSDNSETDFLWSNKSGEIFDIDTGTLCRADIIIKKCTPFRWLIGREL